jgi:hypothetical protein
MNIQEVSKRTLTLRQVMWITDGPALDHSEKTCFRYEVRDDRGNNVGFITADRAMSHPKPCWQISWVGQDGSIGEQTGEYATVEDALSAMQFSSLRPKPGSYGSVLD